jgi:UPF0716 family protein affecting phage T7 exclusion
LDHGGPLMPRRIGTSRRIWRAGLILLGGWLLLEVALLQLVSARVGWGITLAFLSIKGGIGLVLVGVLAYRGFNSLRNPAGDRPGGRSISAGFGVASGILITLPGLLPPLLGIALLSPSLQSAILARFAPAPATGSPKAFDLEASDWREIRRRKLSARRRPRKSIA